MTPPPEEITVWLARWREGDQHARDQVFDVVHSRLREIAGRLLQPVGGDHTLEPNALVNELCIRLIGNQTINYNDRALSSLSPRKRCGGSSSTMHAPGWRRNAEENSS